MLEASRSKRERLGQTGSTAFSELPGIKDRGMPKTAGNKMGITGGLSIRTGGQSMEPGVRNSVKPPHQRNLTGNDFAKAYGAQPNVRSSYAPNSVGTTVQY